MATFIQIGKCYPQYLNIIYAIIATIVKDFSFGSHNVEYFKDLKVWNCGNLSESYFIHQMFCFLVTGIISFFLYKREDIDERHKSEDLEVLDMNLNNQVESNATIDIELIHNDNKVIKGYPNKYLLIIITVWVVNEEFLNIFDNIFIHLDFWMLELIIITGFMYYILNLKIYRHQVLMLISCIIPLMLKAATIILSYDDKNNNDDGNYRYGYNPNINISNHFDYSFDNNTDNNTDYSLDYDKLKILYVVHRPLIVVGIIFYLVLITVRSYINTKIKWLIDIIYTSKNKILAFYGLIGTIFCFLISFIATFISCGDWDENDPKRYIADYFCKVHYNNKRYLESFAAYFSFSEEDTHIYSEMLSLIVGIAAFFFYRIYFMKIIEFLTPVHIIFAFPIYYLFNKSYLCIINIIKNGYAIISDIEYAGTKLSLDFTSDVFSLFGFLVYLEIIELNFCRLDYNLKRKILDRGLIDVTKADLNRSFNSNSDSGASSRNRSFSSLNDSDM